MIRVKLADIEAAAEDRKPGYVAACHAAAVEQRGDKLVFSDRATVNKLARLYAMPSAQRGDTETRARLAGRLRVCARCPHRQGMVKRPIKGKPPALLIYCDKQPCPCGQQNKPGSVALMNVKGCPLKLWPGQ